MINNFGINLTIAFKTYFDRKLRKYFISPVGNEDESVVFIKLDKKFVIFI